MPKTMNLAKRLKEQKQRESAITQDLMKQQLNDMRNELTDILKNELNIIKKDTQNQAKSISWSMFKSRILWPSITGLSLCVGILGGSWAITHYLANKAVNLSQQIAIMNQSIETLEAEGGKAQWNYCGDKRRLCVKTDQKATPYGENGEWRIVEGY